MTGRESVRKICALLKNERTEFQCAAALILGELRERDPSVIRFLGETLGNGHNPMLKGYVLDALEKIGSHHSLPFVLPLLESDNELREKAVRVVAKLGGNVTRELSARLAKATPAERRAIHLVLARVRGADAIRLLLESLVDSDHEVVEETLFAVRQELRSAHAREKRGLLQHVRRFLTSRAAKKSVNAQAAALRILGLLDDVAVESVLLPYTRAHQDPAVRAAALAALRSAPRPKGGHHALAKALLGYLDDKDFQNVVGPSLDILYTLTLGQDFASHIEPLTRSSRMDVKRFAVKKLRESDGARSAEVLLRFLDDEDPTVRDLAAESLMAVKSARGALLERLLRETREEKAWVYARILRSHSEGLSKDQVRRLAEKVTRLLDAEQRLYEPLLFLVRHASPTHVRTELVKRGLRKKRSRRFEEAARTFRLLERHELFDAEIRYELAVSLLKLSPRVVVGDGRFSDQALQLVSSLVPEKFPVFERLRHETVLGPTELFYVGFHLAERTGAEKDVGGNLLHLVMRKAPKSPLAKDARARLQACGIK